MEIPNEFIRYFMNCYFNDIWGTTAFWLGLSSVLAFVKRDFSFKFYHIAILTFLCGLFWEYITPIYRKESVCDPIDIICYLFGGTMFWYLFKGKTLLNQAVADKS